MRIFAFPFAGGDVSAFRHWRAWMPDEFELVCVQLPGRGCRDAESMPDRMHELIEELAAAFVSALDKPYIVLGYSVGALMAYALLQALMKMGIRSPALFCVAACNPFHLNRHPWDRLSDHRILHILANSDSRMQAVPLQKLRSNLPLIKKDLHLGQQYARTEGIGNSQLNCPMLTIAGTRDEIADPENLRHWQQYTTSSCVSRCVEGEHFFLFDSLQLPRLLMREFRHALNDEGAGFGSHCHGFVRS
ncbi:MAG: thioesterase II family protein [Gammaproteobacteria bacterium]